MNLPTPGRDRPLRPERAALGIGGPPSLPRIVLFSAMAAALVVIVILGFGALMKTPADRIAISYGGGPFEGNQFQRIVRPGSSLTFNGLLDSWYEYPVTQRNYIISMRPDEGDIAGSDTVVASTDDKITVQWEVAVYFKLNTALLRQFHENIGLKYQAWTENGWERMLNDSFRQQIESALQIESRRFTAEDLLGDEDAVNEVQAGVARTLQERVSSVLGQEYFCGPTFLGLPDSGGTVSCPEFTVTLKKPTLPEAVLRAFEQNRVSASEVVTAQNRAAALEEEARGVARQRQALNDGAALSPEFLGYLRSQAMVECARNPGCTMVVAPEGTGVNVISPGAPGA